jgi:hypothetical protein
MHLLNAFIYIPDGLCIIASRRNDETAKTALVKDMVLLSCEYFFDYAKCTLHLTSAENLVRVMQILSNFVPTEAQPRRNVGMFTLFIELICIDLTIARILIAGRSCTYYFMCIQFDFSSDIKGRTSCEIHLLWLNGVLLNLTVSFLVEDVLTIFHFYHWKWENIHVFNMDIDLFNVLTF